MNESHYVTTIEKYSDYDAHDPCWIRLHNIDNAEEREKISHALNCYFDRHSSDANEDYARCDGPLMQYSTAKNALDHAVKKCKINIDTSDLIDGGYSLESDGRETDPVTGELLHTIPINEDSVIDEINYLIEQDELSKEDWVWLHFVVCGYGNHNMAVNAKLRQITRKHR